MTKVKTSTVRWKDEEDEKLFVSAPKELDNDDFAASEDEFDADDERAHSNLMSDIIKLSKRKKIGAAPRSVRVSTKEEVTEVDTQDILSRIGIAGLEKSTKKVQTLTKPLEKVPLRKAKRAAGYDKVCVESNKWGSLVHKRRIDEQLTFPLQQPDIRINTALKTEEVKMRTPLEEEVYSLLQGAKLIENKKETNEEIARKRAMSLEELKERNRLVWRQKLEKRRIERKAWMQNKNKSRKFHRLLRRDRLKKQKAELEELEKTNPEAALEKLEELERARVEERMTLRHRTSKWSHLQGLRATRDEKAMAALKDNRDIHQELIAKRRKEDSSSEDDDENVEGKLEALKKERRDAIEAGLFDPSNPWTASLLQQVTERSKVVNESPIDDSFVNFKKFWDEVNKRRLIEKKAREAVERKIKRANENNNDDDAEEEAVEGKGKNPKEDDAEVIMEDEDDSSLEEMKDDEVQITKTINGKMKGANNLKKCGDEGISLTAQRSAEDEEDSGNKQKVKADNKQKRNGNDKDGVKKKKKKKEDEKDSGNKQKVKADNKQQINGNDKDGAKKKKKKKKKKKNIKTKDQQIQKDIIKDNEDKERLIDVSNEDTGREDDGTNVDDQESVDNVNKKGKKKNQLKKKKKKKESAGAKTKPSDDIDDIEEHLISIDNMFNQAELGLQKKLKRKLEKLGIDVNSDKGWTKVESKKKKKDPKEDKDGILPKIEEFDFTTTKTQDNIVEGLERATTLQDMEDLQNKTDAEDRLQKAAATLKTGDVTKGANAESKKTQSVKVAQVDPSKFMQVDAKMLQTAMPDTITRGIEGLDDDEDENEAEDIIREAFKDDYLVDEFRSEKDAAIQRDKPKTLSLALPGWGEWTGPNMTVSKRKRRRFTIHPPAAPPRKDATMGNVIYNEKADVHDNLRKAMVSEVPYPFSRVQDFEASVRAPIGRMFVPEKEHQNLTAPPVVTKIGTVIPPMTEEELLKYNSIYKKKETKTSGGTEKKTTLKNGTNQKTTLKSVTEQRTTLKSGTNQKTTLKSCTEKKTGKKKNKK